MFSSARFRSVEIFSDECSASEFHNASSHYAGNLIALRLSRIAPGIGLDGVLCGRAHLHNVAMSRVTPCAGRPAAGCANFSRKVSNSDFHQSSQMSLMFPLGREASCAYRAPPVVNDTRQ